MPSSSYKIDKKNWLPKVMDEDASGLYHVQSFFIGFFTVYVHRKSKSELDYYHQNLNVRAASRFAQRHKN